jgi:hypothetical protein
VVKDAVISADGDWRCLGRMAPLAKTPKRRAVQIGFTTYFLLVRYLFRVEINNWVRDCGRGRLRAGSLPISEMEKCKLRHYLGLERLTAHCAAHRMMRLCWGST